jgi:hypothetical protein
MGEIVDFPATSSLIENSEFVSDMCRYSESILDEKFLRRKYNFDPGVWDTLGSDERLVARIEDERLRRQRNGDSAREKAQQLFVGAPAVLGGLLNNESTHPRFKIESARELRAIAAVGLDATPAMDRFSIVINLGSVVENYDVTREVGVENTVIINKEGDSNG